MGNQDSVEEDLAIHDTLLMDVEQRLELLASLIVEKITEEQIAGEPLYRKIRGLPA